MWVMTKDGFFSINKPDWAGEGKVVIRARVRADLERLQHKGIIRGILDTPEADYPHRAEVEASTCGYWLQMECIDLNYSNFKNKIAEREPVRAALYARIWEVGVMLTSALRPGRRSD